MTRTFSFLIFTLTYCLHSQANCPNQETLDFKLKDPEAMVADNCIDPKNPRVRIRLRTKAKFCKCVKGNVNKLDPSSINIEDKDLKEKADKALDKAKIALLSLSEELFLMNSDSKLQKINLGPKCNSKHHLTERILKCGGKKNLVYENQEERENILKNLYEELKTDSQLDSPRNYPNKKYINPKALYDRMDFNKKSGSQCMIDSPISQKLVTDINHQMLHAQLSSFISVISEKVESSNQFKTINDVIYHLKEHNLFTLNISKNFMSKLRSNPILNHIINSESFLSSALSSPENIKGIIDKYTEEQKNKSEIVDNIQKKCDATFEAIETAICSSKDDNFIPNVKEESPTPLRRYLSENYDTENQSDLLESSYVSFNSYCIENTSKKSIFDKISETANLVNQDRLKEENSFKAASTDIYLETTLDYGSILCDHMPPGIDKLEAKMKADGCESSDKELSSDCMTLKATYNLLKPTYDQKIEDTRELAIESARENGITDEAKLNELADRAESSLNQNDIIEAYSDYHLPKEETAMMRSFLGGPEPTSNGDSTSSNVASRGSLNSNSASRSSNSNILGDIDGIGDQDSVKKTTATTPAQRVQQQTAQNMDNFYKNIADRIVKRRKTPAKTRTKTNTSGQVASNSTPSRFASSSSNSASAFDDNMSEFDRDEAQAAMEEEMLVDSGEIPRSESSLATRAPASASSEEKAESNEERRVRERNEALTSLANKVNNNTVKMLNDGSIELPDLTDEELNALLSEDPRLAENQLKQIKKIKEALKANGEFVIVPKDKDFKVIVKKVDGKLKITSVLKKVGDKFVDIKFLQKSDSFYKIKQRVFSFINNNNIISLLKKKESLYDELNSQITLK